jgi:16S rRNA (guanine527-N7)-methyltransferase
MGAAGGASEDLGATLEAFGIEASAGQIQALRRFLGELELWNRKRDLVKAKGSGLITRHVADSLAGLATVRRELGRAGAAAGGVGPAGATAGAAPPPETSSPGTPGRGGLFDLGSGGGFPGIPLSVFLAHTRVVLVERSGGKSSFLRSAAAVAGLTNVSVVNADFRHVTLASTSGGPAVVTFRALSEIDRALAGKLARLIGPGGSVVAYKGRRDRAQAEATVAGAVFDEVEVVPVEVPGLEEERTLLVLRLAAGSS